MKRQKAPTRATRARVAKKKAAAGSSRALTAKDLALAVQRVETPRGHVFVKDFTAADVQRFHKRAQERGHKEGEPIPEDLLFEIVAESMCDANGTKLSTPEKPIDGAKIPALIFNPVLEVVGGMIGIGGGDQKNA